MLSFQPHLRRLVIANDEMATFHGFLVGMDISSAIRGVRLIKSERVAPPLHWRLDPAGWASQAKGKLNHDIPLHGQS
jgi:hypothetical protein